MIIVSQDSTGLAYAIARQMDLPIIQMKTMQFADGEIHVALENPQAVQGKRVTIIQSTGFPVNEHVLTVAFMIQELKNAGAAHIRTVVPYFGYSRQETGNIPGKPGEGAVIAQLIENAGSHEVVMVEVHKERLLSFFTIPAISISLIPFIAQHIADRFSNRDGICLVAPDQGAQARVQTIADLLGIPTIIFSKERYAADATRILSYQGSCEGRDGIIIDDIISTGGTAIQAAQKAKELGCRNLYGYFIHPVLAGDAYNCLDKSVFSKIFVTNTLPVAALTHKIELLDISAVISEALTLW